MYFNALHHILHQSNSITLHPTSACCTTLCYIEGWQDERRLPPHPFFPSLHLNLKCMAVHALAWHCCSTNQCKHSAMCSDSVQRIATCARDCSKIASAMEHNSVLAVQIYVHQIASSMQCKSVLAVHCWDVAASATQSKFAFRCKAMARHQYQHRHRRMMTKKGGSKTKVMMPAVQRWILNLSLNTSIR